MVAKIIQAVAGAGKTYFITHKIPKDKRSLYITFTNGNVRNISKELLQSDRECSTYMVSTFSKFIIDWCISPYFSKLEYTPVNYVGFTTVEAPKNNYKNPNNGYVPKKNVGHYSDLEGHFYLDRIAEFICDQPTVLRKEMFQRIRMFVDIIIVDEYQDLSGFEFNLLKYMCKQTVVDILLVGDIFQADVTQTNMRKSNKLVEYKSNVTIEDFLKKKFAINKLVIDYDTLSNSRRISINAANFVESKLKIPIKSEGIETGTVNIIHNEDELDTIYHLDMKILIYSNAINHDQNDDRFLTWTYSKGDTYEDVLVILTKTTDFITQENLDGLTNLALKTRNSLYVALTRAKGRLFIVNSKLWKKYGTF